VDESDMFIESEVNNNVYEQKLTTLIGAIDGDVADDIQRLQEFIVLLPGFIMRSVKRCPLYSDDD
jgi:hypothetical protein